MSSQLPTLDALSAIEGRRSVRAFLDTPVENATIKKILETARWAPSGVNTQPWHVAVLGPTTRQQISDNIIHARESGQKENPDYQYYPTEWEEPYKTRRKACGAALYSALDIDYADKERRKVQWYKNYTFFGAPVALIFFIDAKLCKGSWMDTGMFIQNVMLAARGMGLETCPQAALAEYPDIVREALKLDESSHIVCGMAMGYADWNHPVNQYRTEREALDKFTSWYE